MPKDRQMVLRRSQNQSDRRCSGRTAKPQQFQHQHKQYHKTVNDHTIVDPTNIMEIIASFIVPDP